MQRQLTKINYLMYSFYIMTAIILIGLPIYELYSNGDVGTVGKILMYLSAIINFSVFDILGYYDLLTHKETIKNYDSRLYSYRVIQTTYQIVLAIMLFVVYDKAVAIFFILSWWFGLCDVLYTLLRGKIIKNWNNMYWLWWTVFGLISPKLRNSKMLYFSSILIFVISIIYLILF